jgi:DNA-binding PadR family transcriptional regulator
MRPLGETQRDVLASLKRSGGYWHAGCGWYWDTHSGTTRIMESLLRRGLVEKSVVSGFGWGEQVKYTLTEAGRAA